MPPKQFAETLSGVFGAIGFVVSLPFSPFARGIIASVGGKIWIAALCVLTLLTILVLITNLFGKRRWFVKYGMIVDAIWIIVIMSPIGLSVIIGVYKIADGGFDIGPR